MGEEQQQKTADPEKIDQPLPEQSDADRGQLAALTAERAKRQDAEKRLADLERKAVEDERKAAEKRGEFERLYTTEKARAEALAAKVAESDAREAARVKIVESRNAVRVEAMPKDLRSLVPSLAPDALAAWLDEAIPRLVGVDPVAAGGLRSRGGAADGVPPEVLALVKAEADGRGMDPKAWWAAMSADRRARLLKRVRGG